MCHTDDQWHTGVWRGCATEVLVECRSITNEPLPELHLTDATVDVCYCIGHLCNAGARIVVGGTVLAITGSLAAAAGLLALAAARLVVGG